MKQFLKFIVSILVIAIMLFTVYFLMQNASRYIENSISGNVGDSQDTKSGDNDFQINQNENLEIDIPNNSGEDLESGNIINEIVSGDYNVSDEIVNDDISEENVSGNKIYSAEENVSSKTMHSVEEIKLKVDEINKLENQNKSANVTKTIEDSVGIDIIGIKNRDFFQSFNLSEMSVTVQVAGSMVYIIPASDFIDNGQFHYDENGKLVLYIRELAGIGEEIRYYFENNQFLKQELKIEEDIQIDTDDVNEILQRAKKVFEKYMK